MSQFRALYYPSWNPPVKWLRSMLLFFDQINVIRPKEVENPEYHDANKAVFELIPQAFCEIKKRHYEMALATKNKRLLASALDYIAEGQKHKTKGEFVVKVSPGGNLSVPGYAFLHVSKLNPWLSKELDRRSLFLKPVESIFENEYGMRKFRILERRACNMVLALLADYYAQEQRLRTITNENLSYIANTLNVNPMQRRETAATNLASAILRIEIPENIENYSAKEYVALRKRYAELREPFQHTVRQLCDDYQLADIRSKKDFEAAIHEASRNFCAETRRLRKGRWTKRVKNWSVMGLGVLSSFCSLGSGSIVNLGVGLSVVLHVYQGLIGSEHITEKRRAQQLIGDLKGEIAHPILLRRISLT